MIIDAALWIRIIGVLLLLGFGILGFSSARAGSQQLRPSEIAMGISGWALLLAAEALEAVASVRTGVEDGLVELFRHGALILILLGAVPVILMMRNRLDPSAPGSWLPPPPRALNRRGRRYRWLMIVLFGLSFLLWVIHLALRLTWS